MKFIKTRAFPSFFKDYAPKLIDFFGAWIDWLNLEGNAAYIIDHLSSERDIDNSIDAYKTHIKDKLMADYPASVSSDLKLLLKNIFYLYNSKASVKSYDFLFRCLFNSPATIFYPKEKILRASDGRWYIPKYISIGGYDNLIIGKNYSSYMITGVESNSTAYLNGNAVYAFKTGSVNENGIEIKDVKNGIILASVIGHFKKNEHLTIKNPETNEDIDLPNLFVEYYEEAVGKHEGTKGFLNSDMVLQDSHYYQDFSYMISSSVTLGRWRKIVENILHPAGLQFFGEMLINEDKDNDGVGNLEVNPTEFLRYWQLFFKMYVFDKSSKIQFYEWQQSINSLAQRHSETQDAWLNFGRYHQSDGYSKIIVDTANNFFNKSSVLLFRENGTLIHPEIINWATFEFTENIEGSKVHGITLDPKSHVISGVINGDAWKPEVEESFITNDFFCFITDTSPNQHNKVKEFVVGNKYLRYDEDSEGKDEDVGETYLYYEAKKFPNKITKWENLFVDDYIMTSKAYDRYYDYHSLLKVPDNFISTINNNYKVLNRSYDNENIVVFSHSPKDFTHKIFINRENTNVDIYYTNYTWYENENPSNPILDTNLYYDPTQIKYSISDTKETFIYNCESKSYDPNGNEVLLEQTQFKLKLPYLVDKNNVVVFTNGKLSKNFKIEGATIFVDTEDKDREIICYIQSDNTITADKAGKVFLYLLDEKSLFYDDDGLQYYIQDSGYITTDFIGVNVKYKVAPYKTIYNLNNIEVYYYFDNNTITMDKEGKQIAFFIEGNKLIYADDKSIAFYLQDDGRITDEEDGTTTRYIIQSYRVVTDLDDNALYHWNSNNTITTISQEKTLVYFAKRCSLIVEGKNVRYFIQSDKTVTTDVQGSNVVYYVQPDNAITTNYILYNSTSIEFEDCTQKTIISTSETSSESLEEFTIFDNVVIELDNAVTKSFGDLTLNEMIYHIYGIEQTRISSTAEIYILSPNNGLRQESTPYTHDKRFTYNAAVLSPFGLSNHLLEHIHIVDHKEMYNMDIEANEWFLNWFKFFNIEPSMQRIWNLSMTLPAQRHSETMDTIFARNLINMYHTGLLTEEERQTALNNNSMLVFDEDGLLVDNTKIDWHNMTYEGSNVLYSVQLNSDTLYAGTPSNDNYFMFINGKKVLDENRTLNLSNNNACLYNYHNNFIDEYYTGKTETIVYLNQKGITTELLRMLFYITGDTIIQAYDGNTKLLKDAQFSDFIEDGMCLYDMTGADGIITKTKLYNLNKDYILVFVDGVYTTNWEYKTNGSIVLKTSPKNNYEVYVLKPYDYNIQDKVVRGTNSFTFNNLRLNYYSNGGEKQLVDEKLFVTPSDLLFVKHQLHNLTKLKQSMSFWHQLMRTSDTLVPNSMLHYTMDRLMRYGTFDVLPYTSNDSPTIVNQPIRYVCNFDGNIVYYIQHNNEITIDERGDDIVYYLIDDGIYSDSMGEELVYTIDGYNILQNDEVVYHLKLDGVKFVDPPTKFIYDLDSNLVYYIQSDNTITSDIYGDNIVYFIIDTITETDELERGVYSGAIPTEEDKVYVIENNNILSLDGIKRYSIKTTGRPIYELDTKFNRNSTMLFDKEGLLINPYNVNWSINTFVAPQLTKEITSVCLNSSMPVIVGYLEKTNQIALLVRFASIEDEISQTKIDMEFIEKLGIEDKVLRNPYTYADGELEKVGVTDFVYQNNGEPDAFETVYIKEDEFIEDNVWVFANGKKVFKDDLVINGVKNYYITHNFEKYIGPRIRITDVANITEEDLVMEDTQNSYDLSMATGEMNTMYVDDVIQIDDFENFTEKTDIVNTIINAKECIIYQYNPNDIEAIIELKNDGKTPMMETRRFTLPKKGVYYTKDNLLVFKNGVRTTDYQILGNELKLNGDDTLDTVEIYVFKRYDYLFVDENKYNQKCYNFTIKNLKRSIFF